MEEISIPNKFLCSIIRKVLIIAGPKGVVEGAIKPHEVIYAKNIQSALEILSSARPDVVIYFAKGKNNDLEEHVMMWLIEGFRGKFILIDPSNRVRKFQTLIESQVVDEYISGPVSPTNFISLIKSQLSQDMRFASPRAMTTFDLFRNLFDRGLNPIFFFPEDLNRCVAANLRAERMTGRSLKELRRLSLRELCDEREFDHTTRIIRRASRHFYDAKGNMILKDHLARTRKVTFSCGVFNFGRKNFVKIEVQDTPAESVGALAATSQKKGAVIQDRREPNIYEEYFMRTLDEKFSLAAEQNTPITLVLCRVNPLKKDTSLMERKAVLRKVDMVLQKKIRKTETISRVSSQQFAIFIPKAPEKKVNQFVERIRRCLKEIPEFAKGDYDVDIGMAQCPPQAYPFLGLLRSVKEAAPESLLTH